jgi:hypothetical protein
VKSSSPWRSYARRLSRDCRECLTLYLPPLPLTGFIRKQMISPDHSHFLTSFAPGGPYEGTIGIYRRNASAAAIGNFDESLVNALAETSTVRWIAQNGSGYDQIDVQACKARGKTTQTLARVPSLTQVRYLFCDCRHSRVKHAVCQRRCHSPNYIISDAVLSSPLLHG